MLSFCKVLERLNLKQLSDIINKMFVYKIESGLQWPLEWKNIPYKIDALIMLAFLIKLNFKQNKQIKMWYMKVTMKVFF